MEALHHKSNSKGTSDGMDISLVIIDPADSSIKFAAAHHTMFLIKNKQLELVKGERVPIGYHFKSKKFTTKNIQLQKGDMIYLTSDGYTDQLGEKTLNRFMQGKFTDFLQVIHNDPLEEQKKVLEEKLDDWKGNVEQTDDILVMGLRI
jgi:serine phosphatase RsbU (regulator of sigma subunit)